jgi:nicotinamidase-related amidase
MSKNDELRYGAPGETAVHLCVDMQRIFAEGTEWKMPWLERVLPNILSITSTHPEKTIFTRFIPAHKAGPGRGDVAALLRALGIDDHRPAKS